MRDGSTYRSARRNLCIREMRMVWTPEWYYKQHRNAPRWWAGDDPNRNRNQMPIYIPAKRVLRKTALGKNDIHAMLKRGDYAAAVRKMYERGENGEARIPKVSGAGGSSGGSGDTV